MLSKIEDILREVGQSTVMPSYRRLSASDIEEKSVGEVVTTVDRVAEQQIAARLKDLVPDVVVIGEEGAAATPRLLTDFYDGVTDRCWLIDPLDGTANFVAGEGKFAMMVALIDKGSTVASCIYEPATARMSVCELGSGAYIDGRRVSVTEPALDAQLRGSVLDRFLPAEERARIAGNLGNVVRTPGSKCAGWDYPALAEGTQDFNLYWRLLPWDHAPGVLFLREAGGCARYFDGSTYRAADQKSGLIAAVTETAWERTRNALLG